MALSLIERLANLAFRSEKSRLKLNAFWTFPTEENLFWRMARACSGEVASIFSFFGFPLASRTSAMKVGMVFVWMKGKHLLSWVIWLVVLSCFNPQDRSEE